MCKFSHRNTCTTKLPSLLPAICFENVVDTEKATFADSEFHHVVGCYEENKTVLLHKFKKLKLIVKQHDVGQSNGGSWNYDYLI